MTDQLQLVMAVDGGQSSTLAMVATIDGHIVGTGFAGPSNHVDEPGGQQRLQTALELSANEALAEAGLATEQVVSICLGMTGGAEMAAAFMKDYFPSTRVQSHYDTVTALAGASMTKPGIVVIAGTGAVAYGRLADGREGKADGWGFIMGDEGSGYDIGLRALQAAAQASDDRIENTMLLDLIPTEWGLENLKAVHKAVYAGQVTRPQIARLTVAVVTAASAGDKVAKQLLEQAGKRLANTALAVVNQLMVKETGITVFPTGGVFQSSDVVKTAFRYSLLSIAPKVIMQEPHFPPIAGGLMLALEAVEGGLNETVIANLQATFPRAAASKHEVREQQS